MKRVARPHLVCSRLGRVPEANRMGTPCYHLVRSLGLIHFPQHKEQDRTHGSQTETDGPEIGHSQPGSPPPIVTATPPCNYTPHSSRACQAFSRIFVIQTNHFPPNSAKPIKGQAVNRIPRTLRRRGFESQTTRDSFFRHGRWPLVHGPPFLVR